MDELRKTAKSLLIAVDGGGSKTRFLSFDNQGKIHRYVVLGPSNPNAIGTDPCIRLLIDGIRQVCREAADPDLICLGIAGTYLSNLDHEIEQGLQSVFPLAQIECRSDVFNLMRACDQTGDLMAAVCGTGFSVFVRAEGQLHLFGGWGSLISPKGSGLDIVRDAIRAILEDLTRMGPRTSLTQKLSSLIGNSEPEIIRYVYQNHENNLASLSPLVFEASSEGDAVARKIIADHIRELCRFCRAAYQAYPNVKTLFLSGGVATHQKEFEGLVRDEIGDILQIRTLRTPQLIGACFRCIDKLAPQDLTLLQNLRLSFESFESKIE